MRAAYVEDSLTFRHIIQAIVVPSGDERSGMLLAGLLNSKLMLWFTFHGTSSFGCDAPGTFDYAEDDDTSVAAALSRLGEQIHQPLPGNFQSMPDFRLFIDRDLFLVKPAGKRFWLRSTALADANAIALDLHEVTGRRLSARSCPA